MDYKIINVKGVIWLDADDVLIDFHRKFHDHLNHKYKLNIPIDYEPQYLDYRELFTRKEISIQETISQLPPEWWNSQTQIFGASNFTHKLKELGYRIVILTSIEPSKGMYRVSNLISHGIYFDEIYFTKNIGMKKGDVAFRMLDRYSTKNHIFVDDMAKNCHDFLMKVPFSKAFTLDVAYNHSEEMDHSNRFLARRLDISSKTNAELFTKVLKYARSDHE